MLGSQIQIEDDHQRGADKPHQHNGAGQQLGVGGEQEFDLIDIDRHICLSHNIQIDGIQGDLGENTRQNIRDTQLCVQEPGDQSGHNSRKERHQQRQLGIPAAHHQHNAHSAAGCQTAVNRQVRNIQHTEGHIHTQRHNAPDQTLGNTAGTGPEQRGRI